MKRFMKFFDFIFRHLYILFSVILTFYLLLHEKAITAA